MSDTTTEHAKTAPVTDDPASDGTASDGTASDDAAQAEEGASRWRVPAVLAGCVVAAGVIIALLQPSAAPSGYLDPGSTSADGAHALADLAAGRGQHVERVTTVTASTASTASIDSTASTGSTGELELVTSPDLLSAGQLGDVARFGGDVLLIDPDPAALDAIAPGVQLQGRETSISVNAPLCNLPSANLAGNADVDGGVLQTSDASAQTCYPGGGGYSLVRFKDGARTITVLGTGTPLTNQYLADKGDAALALNLLENASTIVWVVPPQTPPGSAAQPAAPGPASPSPPSGSGGPGSSSPGSAGQSPPGSNGSSGGSNGSGSGSAQKSLTSLIPWPAYLILIQLVIAALLAAAWRARRLGPLVPERLPVVVRASETVEGHGRLYQARRARDRAAAELRAAALTRITRLTGTGTGTGTQALANTIAARTGQDPDEVRELLFGPPPETDTELVTLAADLDTLERKVRQP